MDLSAYLGAFGGGGSGGSSGAPISSSANSGVNFGFGAGAPGTVTLLIGLAGVAVVALFGFLLIKKL